MSGANTVHETAAIYEAGYVHIDVCWRGIRAFFRRRIYIALPE